MMAQTDNPRIETLTSSIFLRQVLIDLSHQATENTRTVQSSLESATSYQQSIAGAI
jgi:hypothetical protein